MLNYGADAIFTIGSNLRDKDIDQMIEDGEARAYAQMKASEEKIGEKFNMVDFEMNTINLYQFEDEDYAKSRREAEALKMQDYVLAMVTNETTDRKRRCVQNKIISFKETDLCPKIFTGKTVGISQETIRKKLQVV